jgi:hypothetical protein
VDRKQHLYLWLAGIFVTALLIGDLTGGRYFRVGSFDLSAGMLLFPITFVLTDVVNEFYGPVGAKRITFLGLGLAGLAFLFINVVLALPPSKIGLPSEAVTQVLGSAAPLHRLAGRLPDRAARDITIFGLFRRLTGHRMIWLRGHRLDVDQPGHRHPGGQRHLPRRHAADPHHRPGDGDRLRAQDRLRRRPDPGHLRGPRAHVPVLKISETPEKS